jgi:hypothetical protein
MEMISATESISPKTTKSKAIPKERREALKGSLVFPFPREKKMLSLRKGNILSFAIA